MPEESIENFVLITVDCLRADHLYEMDGLGVHAPNLSRFMDRSLRFRKAVTNGPGTRFAFPAMMMSKLPGELAGTGLPKGGGLTLAEFLRRHGFATIGLNSNGWLSRDFNYDRGFEYFFDPINWAKKEQEIKLKYRERLKKSRFLFKLAKAGWDVLSLLDLNMAFSYQLADAMNGKLWDTIERNGLRTKKKFIWIHYMDAHHPFCVHRDAAEKYPALKGVSQKHALGVWRKAGEDVTSLTLQEVSLLKDLYKSEITYLDRFIGEVIDAFPDALIILTADHGEEFGEHGRFHAPTFYSEMLCVPLVVYYPGAVPGDSEALISHVDIAPYAASLLGLDYNSYNHGWSGSPEPLDVQYQFAMFEDGDRKGVCVLDKMYKYVVGDNGDAQLYTRDDAYAAYEEGMGRFKDVVGEHMKRAEAAATRIDEPEVSQVVMAQLKSLGYF